MIPVVLDTNILMASLLKESGSNRAALAKVIDLGRHLPSSTVLRWLTSMRRFCLGLL